MAWWFLSRQASQLLEEKRDEGMFGGMPGKAPYWYVQDQGDPRVGVRAQLYIERSVKEFEQISEGIVEDFFAT